MPTTYPPNITSFYSSNLGVSGTYTPVTNGFNFSVANGVITTPEVARDHLYSLTAFRFNLSGTASVQAAVEIRMSAGDDWLDGGLGAKTDKNAVLVYSAYPLMRLKITATTTGTVVLNAPVFVGGVGA